MPRGQNPERQPPPVPHRGPGAAAPMAAGSGHGRGHPRPHPGEAPRVSEAFPHGRLLRLLRAPGQQGSGPQTRRGSDPVSAPADLRGGAGVRRGSARE